MHKMIMYLIKTVTDYTEGHSLQVLIFDKNNEKMKKCLTVCLMKTLTGGRVWSGQCEHGYELQVP